MYYVYIFKKITVNQRIGSNPMTCPMAGCEYYLCHWAVVLWEKAPDDLFVALGSHFGSSPGVLMR